MEVIVRAQGMTLRPLIRDSIEAHVRDGLRRYAARVARVTLTVEDLHAIEANASQHCLIELKLKTGRVIHLDERAQNLLAAVSGATERIKRGVERSLEQRSLEQRSLEQRSLDPHSIDQSREPAHASVG